MLVIGDLKSRIALDIQSHQFPGSPPDGWDSEWLRVSGNARCPHGEWNFNDACLTTFELKALADWLRDLSVHDRNRKISFTEPNLRFERVEDADGAALKVWFSQESAPPWISDEERLGRGWALRISREFVNFADAAEAVAAMCERFPTKARDFGNQ